MAEDQLEHLRAASRMPEFCPIFGAPIRMKMNMLPRLDDMFMDYLWIRHDMKLDTNVNKEPTVAEVSDALAYKIKEIWDRASIPTVTITRILQLIRFHHDKYLKIVQYPKMKRNAEYEAKVTRFREEFSISHLLTFKLTTILTSLIGNNVVHLQNLQL